MRGKVGILYYSRKTVGSGVLLLDERLLKNNEVVFLNKDHVSNIILCRPVITARVRSTREGNVLTSVCPSIHPSVCPQGGVPGPPRGGTRTPPGGYPDPPPGGYPDPPRGVPSQVPPGQDRRSTHYTAGGMPLAFTQEDFLVFLGLN